MGRVDADKTVLMEDSPANGVKDKDSREGGDIEPMGERAISTRLLDGECFASGEIDLNGDKRVTN